MPTDPVDPQTPASPAEVSDEAIRATREHVTRLLLDARNAAGYWEGELSSSALSTATAIFTLAEFRRCPAAGAHPELAAPAPGLIDAGARWLVANQNADGGWGDTTRSFSNISTTALCWAALSVADAAARPAVAAAEAWLKNAAGSLAPADLARAIVARYGKDRTFSVPILTMCALAGRLGEPEEAWQLVPQLPFELAPVPQAWFRFVRLPVVSYALPALIAMGFVRHRKRPTWNPLTRAARRLAAARTLRTLAALQPANGGFLEATPLTSFVVMSLIGAGRDDHAVVPKGVEFLLRSARPDGSWPIDTNLSTWVTTLSVNALASGGGASAVAEVLSPDERRAVRQWLLWQQYTVAHAYTGAAPGGWAWTDLPGGVPDADDTAGALLALHHLGDVDDDRVARAVVAGVTWLLDLQNGDGGIPTFCRGWTNLPFDRSGPDLTAHALLAWAVWKPRLPSSLARRVTRATAAGVQYLARTQRADGSWHPLWFGSQHAPDDENPTYGTARVLLALASMPDDPGEQRRAASKRAITDRAVRFLLATQGIDGGWGAAAATRASIEETAVATTALALVTRDSIDPTFDLARATRRGREWLATRLRSATPPTASPIGFYFAKLWYYEQSYPVIFAVGCLSTVLRRGAATAAPPPRAAATTAPSGR